MGAINAGYEFGLQYPTAALSLAGFCLLALALALAFTTRTKK